MNFTLLKRPGNSFVWLLVNPPTRVNWSELFTYTFSGWRKEGRQRPPAPVLWGYGAWEAAAAPLLGQALHMGHELSELCLWNGIECLPFRVVARTEVPGAQEKMSKWPSAESSWLSLEACLGKCGFSPDPLLFDWVISPLTQVPSRKRGIAWVCFPSHIQVSPSWLQSAWGMKSIVWFTL